MIFVFDFFEYEQNNNNNNNNNKIIKIPETRMEEKKRGRKERKKM